MLPPLNVTPIPATRVDCLPLNNCQSEADIIPLLLVVAVCTLIVLDDLKRGTGYFSYSNTSTALGTGLSNTLKLYNLTGNNAAKYIYNLSYDGYNDWYIPSSAEWTKISTNWSSLGIPYGNYQCSSEVSQQNSYIFSAYISYGWISASTSNSGKTSLYDVIGIRNF